MGISKTDCPHCGRGLDIERDRIYDDDGMEDTCYHCEEWYIVYKEPLYSVSIRKLTQFQDE